ncbi:MAG: Gfo/Idh/MocA family protein [Spirochaetota bacterium]
MRAIMIGCGGISAAWLTALQDLPQAEIVGLVDLNEKAARARAEEFGLDVPLYTRVEDALDELGPEVAFDCTIPEAHAGTDLLCMEAGCHVLCEKPLAHDLEAAKKVVDAARALGRTHAVMQNRRYQSDIVRFRALLRSGVLGRLTSLHAEFFLGAHFGGFRAEMRNVLLLDMAIHTFDAARFLMDARPTRVVAVEWNPEGSWFAHGAAASVIVTMDNGSVFTYQGNWAAEGLHTSWESSWRAVATGGSAHWDGASTIVAERAGRAEGLVRPGEQIDVPAGTPLEHTGHAGCIHDFLVSVSKGVEPMTVSHDNIYSLAMSLSAVESASSGRTVDIRL